MDESTVYEKMRPIIVEKLEVELQQVQLATPFQELGADSLDIIELAMELEVAFELTIPDRDYEGLATVGDAVRYVATRLASAA